MNGPGETGSGPTERTAEGRALVVMPTYDEAGTLAGLVPRVLEQDARIDVLIIDDASPDGTGDIADALAAADERVTVIHREGKRGLGTAYLRGFRYGLDRGYEYLVEMDSDLSHDPQYLPDLLRAVDEGADVAVGSRYVRGVNVINWPMSRLLLSYYANKYARIATGLPMTDATSGYKCFRRRALEVIDFDRVGSTGYAFQIEMNYRAWRAGMKLVEVPIVFVDRDQGESKMSGAIVREAVWRVWALRFKGVFGGL